MDKFTRNYSIVLGVVVVALVAVFMYEDPQVQSLNDRLLRDTRLSTYPYNFRVLRLENGVATMTTPRSAEFPAYRALGLLFPSLDRSEPVCPQWQVIHRLKAHRAPKPLPVGQHLHSLHWLLQLSGWHLSPPLYIIPCAGSLCHH